MPSYATTLLAAAPLLLLLLLSLPAPSRGVEIKWTPGEDRGGSGSDGIGGALGVGGDSDGPSAAAASAAGSTDAAASSTEATAAEDGSDGSGGGGGGGGSSGNYDPPTSGPLPLSQNQRNQLTQLEQTIMSSPDPRSTLLQVAESNGMAPEELVDLLQRNRQDMEMAAGGGGGGGMGAGRTLPRRFFGLFGTVLAAVGRMASSHPRNFSLVATAVLLVAYAAIQAPRTGIVTSTRPKPLGLSSGYTTFLSPPAPFVATYLNSDRYYNLPSSLPKSVKVGSLSRRIADAVLEMEEDNGVSTEKPLKRKKSKLGLCVTARRTVPIRSLVPRGPSKSKRRREAEDNDDEEEDDICDDDDDEELLTYAAYVAHDAATSVLSSRRYSEFAVSDSQRRADLRFQSSGGRDEAMLIVGGMGDLGRYGLQPLRVAFEEEEGPDVRTVAFHTLQGGHFDGEVRFSVERRVVRGLEDADEEEGEDREERLDRIESVIISVSLVVPRKGRKPSKKLAERVVSTLADSILTSVETEARQTIARQTMSQRYRGRMEGRATERRHLRYLNEKKMEEMSEDRRRRWQRRNPDAGRYRPSGVRMRSPNNC